MRRRDVVLSELARLEDKYGRLDPHEVFAAAKPKSSAIHGEFEWDVKKGWYHHNLDLARGLIKRYRIVTVEGTSKTFRIGDLRVSTPSAYIRDPDVAESVPGYRSIVALAREPDAALRALRREAERVAADLRALRDAANALGFPAQAKTIEECAQRIASMTLEVVQK